MAFDFEKELAAIRGPAQPPARSALGEIGLGFRRSVPATQNMAGQALQWAADPQGNALSRGVYGIGKEIADSAKAELELPGNQFQPGKHSVVTNALAGGAEMLLPSVAAPLAVGAGIAGAGALAPGAAVGAGTGLLAAAALGSVPMGMAQAQQTYENVREAGGSESEAKAAGWKTGIIEAAGETVGTAAGGKLVGVAGKAIGKAVAPGIAGTIGGAVTTDVWKPFAKNLVKTALVETGTEVGQAASQSYIEREAGVDVDPWTQAKEVIGPTLGMTMWLAPFGLHANFRNSNRAAQIDKALGDPAVPTEQRVAVVEALYEEAVKNKIPDATQWKEGALSDVVSGVPIRREAPTTPAEAAQGQLLKNVIPGIVGVKVVDGDAQILVETEEGPAVAKASVKDIVAHMASGQPISMFPQFVLLTGRGKFARTSKPAIVDQSQAEANQFGREALGVNRLRNNQTGAVTGTDPATGALNRDVSPAAREPSLNQQMDELLRQTPETPLPSGVRAPDAPAAPAPSIEEQKAEQEWRRQTAAAQEYNQQANTVKGRVPFNDLRRKAPRTSAPGIAEDMTMVDAREQTNLYSPGLPPLKDQYRLPSGRVFASPRAVVGFLNRDKRDPNEYDIVGTEGGYVAIKKQEVQNEQAMVNGSIENAPDVQGTTSPGQPVDPQQADPAPATQAVPQGSEQAVGVQTGTPQVDQKIQAVAERAVPGSVYQGSTETQGGTWHQFRDSNNRNFSVIGTPTIENVKASSDKMNAQWAKYDTPLKSKAQKPGEDPDAKEASIVQEGVEGKTFEEATKFLVDNAPNKAYKVIATKVQEAIIRLSGLGVQFDLKVSHIGSSVPRALINARGITTTYFEGRGRVEVWLNGADVTGKVGVSYETALHELIHAVTQGAIHLGGMVGNKGTPASNAVVDLITVSNKIISHFNNRVAASKAGKITLNSFEDRVFSRGSNALQNHQEIVAWALSDKEMQDYLDTIPYSKGISLWSKFVTSVRSFLGLPASADTALSEVLRVSEELFLAPVPEMLEAVQGGGTSSQMQTTAQQVSSQRGGNNPDILFSKVSDNLKKGKKELGTALGALSSPKSKLYGLYVQHADKWLSVTPLHTLVQTFGKKMSQIGVFNDALTEIVHVKDSIVTTSAELRDQAYQLAKKTVGTKVLFKAMNTSNFNQMIPWAEWHEQDWVPKYGTMEARKKAADTSWKKAKMDEKTGLSFMEAHRASVDAFKALTSQELKDAYEKIVADVAAVRKREVNNLLAKIEQVTEEGSDKRASLMEQFNKINTNIKGAYLPMSRFGDFILEYTDTDGFRQVKYFTSIAERNAEKAELLEIGVNPQTVKETTKAQNPDAGGAMPRELMSQIEGIVREKFTKGTEDLGTEAAAEAAARAQETIDEMTQAWVRLQTNKQNSIRRQSVRGFEEDALRSYEDYMQRHASIIAWAEQGQKIDDALSSLSKEIKDKMAGGTAVNTDMESAILTDLKQRRHALRTVRTGKLASSITKMGTAWYMTSPSIALVQMSQLGVITLPKMSVMYGPAKAARALMKAFGKALKPDYNKKALFSDDVVNAAVEDFRAVVDMENRSMPQAQGKELGEALYSDKQKLAMVRALSPKQREIFVLREAMARNLLDVSAAYEAMERARGKNPNGFLSKTFNLAMQPMVLSELASRKTAVLSTYELATANGADFFGAMDSIAEVVNDTLFSYAKEGKGWRLQGPTANVLFQFMHFRIMSGLRLALLMKESVRGKDPETRAEAKKEFVGIMGMSGALAGAVGVPMSSAVFAIANAVFGSDDEPYDAELAFANWLRENLGETLGDIVEKGPGMLIGMDISRRIGLGDIYGTQSNPPTNLHGKELAAWWAASLLGPGASVVAGMFQGYDQMVNKGNYMKGLEATLPKPLRDLAKTYRVGTDGLKTGAGKKLLADEKINPDELMLMALGFNPDEISRAQTNEWKLTGLKTEISERRGKLIREAARGIMEGDPTEASYAIRAYNSRAPRYAIQGSEILSALRKQILGDFGATGRRDILVADQYGVPVYRGG